MNQMKCRWKNTQETRDVLTQVFYRKQDGSSLFRFRFLRGSVRRNIPLSLANNVILFCVCSSDTRCSALVFPLLLSIFHVSESASILGAPSVPLPTGCQNIIFEHSPPPTLAIFFLTLALPQSCGRGEADAIVKMTLGSLFSLTIHLWAPRWGFVGIKLCLHHISVNFQQGWCTYSSGIFSKESFSWPLDNL